MGADILVSLKKVLAIIICLACAATLTACWDHVEMNKLLIVAGIGLDADADGLYRATLEFINIESDSAESKIIGGEGDTAYSAMQNAMTLAGGAMFANHCKVLVFGESLARRGIEDVVNLVLRSPGFRKTLDILVAKGATAKSVLESKAVKGDITSFELSKLILSNADTLNSTKPVSVYELHEQLLSPCPSVTAPVVFLKPESEKDAVCVEGTALLYQGKLKGFLDAGQSKIYNLITQQADNGYLSFDAPEASLKPVSARVEKSSARLIPNIEGDRLSMKVKLQAEVILEGSSLLNIDILDKSSVNRLEKEFGSRLSKEAERLVRHVQFDYEADVFNFYKEYEDLCRGEIETWKEDWPSRFKDIEVKADAEVVIAGSGIIGNYRASKGGEPYGNALP